MYDAVAPLNTARARAAAGKETGHKYHSGEDGFMAHVLIPQRAICEPDFQTAALTRQRQWDM
ncbi:hypothetical protein EON80_20180 [bacterium]|nr:MAG: hypothetical protein EON80_20180 [bacterium]